MIEIKNVTIYKCEFCGKIYQRKKYAIKHPKKCRKNPDNKHTCLEYCKYLCKKEIEFTQFDHEGFDYQTKRDALYCEKIKKCVYPFWIKGYDSCDIYDAKNQIDLDNEQMPFVKCEHYNCGL